VRDGAFYGSLRYGAVEMPILAQIVTLVGYLARFSYDAGDSATAQLAHEYLTGLDTTGLHPSVERSRLVALGVLGDWLRILSRLEFGDPPLYVAAANTVKHWVPGPFTPSGYEDPDRIAEWVAAELSRRDANDNPDIRSTLADIKEGLEQQIGRYVIPD
jgi:hypothetical protein